MCVSETDSHMWRVITPAVYLYGTVNSAASVRKTTLRINTGNAPPKKYNPVILLDCSKRVVPMSVDSFFTNGCCSYLRSECSSAVIMFFVLAV